MKFLAQPSSAKKAEIHFRTKLAHQHLTNAHTVAHEYSPEEMHQEFSQKIVRQRVDFAHIRSKKIPLSPYLEIGAGYGQTALLLENEFSAKGYAIDIAEAPLKYIPQLAKKLKYQHIPKRVVCDAERLPFADNSFAFIYCYQTLHHFPHPGAVVSELYRVLMPGGYFFFSEEPVAQQLNIPLWYRPTKLRWWEKILKYTMVLHFISRIGKSEIDEGILENTFNLKVWKETLDIFSTVDATLTPFPFGPKVTLKKQNDTWSKNTWSQIPTRFILWLSGGGISALCQKKGIARKKIPAPKLHCISCHSRKQLRKTANSYFCPTCKRRYLRKKTISYIVPKELVDHYL